MSTTSLYELFKRRLQAAITDSLLLYDVDSGERVSNAYLSMIQVVETMGDLIPRTVKELEKDYLTILYDTWDRLNERLGPPGRDNLSWRISLTAPTVSDKMPKSAADFLSVVSVNMDPTSRSEAVFVMLACMFTNDEIYRDDFEVYLGMVNVMLMMELDTSTLVRPHHILSSGVGKISPGSKTYPIVKASMSVMDAILCHLMQDLCNYKECLGDSILQVATLKMLDAL